MFRAQPPFLFFFKIRCQPAVFHSLYAQVAAFWALCNAWALRIVALGALPGIVLYQLTVCPLVVVGDELELVGCCVYSCFMFVLCLVGSELRSILLEGR